MSQVEGIPEIDGIVTSNVPYLPEIKRSLRDGGSNRKYLGNDPEPLTGIKGFVASLRNDSRNNARKQISDSSSNPKMRIPNDPNN